MFTKLTSKPLFTRQASKLFSTSQPKTEISFNLVIRDHDQSAFANHMNSTLDPRYFQVAYLWDQGNRAGQQQLFGHFETGGQEPGKTAMSGRNPGQLYAKLHEQMPNTWLRSLSRSCYGNSVFPLHPNDLRKWYNFVNKHGKKVIYKVFDYNTNFDEMEIALQVIHDMGAPIEIAVPHSPDPLYWPFFAKKLELAAKKAQHYGATLSVKRMVNGLREAEGREIANLLCPIAKKYGINDVTLHAHGHVNDAIASFLYTCNEHGIAKARGDIVHLGSGGGPGLPGTFPNFYDVCDKLGKLGLQLQPSREQLELLKELERIQAERDQRFAAVRTAGAFSVQNKVIMGMPDGGEAYTVEAIIKTKVPENLGITLQKAQEIFQEYYCEFREKFGMLVSVTPGHKRIEEGALTSMVNTFDWLKKVAADNKVEMKDIDAKFVRKEIKKLNYDVLYNKLNPKTIDALRNGELPVPLTDEAFDYLCRHHMKNTLNQKQFDNLTQEEKKMLISAAQDTNRVSEIANKLFSEKKIPPACITSCEEEYSPLSLLQASGKRIYMEGSGCFESGPKYREMLEKYDKEGAPINHIFGMHTAECLAILSGNPAYIESSAKRGPAPSPENLPVEQYEKELSIYRKYIQSPSGTLITERAHFLTAAEGFNQLYLEEEEEIEELLKKPIQEKEKKLGNPQLSQMIEDHDREIELGRFFTQNSQKVVIKF